MNAARTKYDDYLVFYDISELLKHGRALDFLNQNGISAPKINAIELEQLNAFLAPYLPKKVA